MLKLRFEPIALLLAGTALLAGCAGSRFQTATAKFGAEIEKTMTAQSDQITTVSAMETKRRREEIVSNRTTLSLHDDCFNDPEISGVYKPCTIVALPGSGEEVEFHYDLPAIVGLQRALSSYGKKLALLADDAEADQAAFSASIDKLGTSIGKLDAAISKTAGSDRVATDDRLSNVARIIGSLGQLAFEYQRQHALRRIISANDPLIQEALAVLEKADVEANRYKRVAAQEIARSAAMKAKFSTSEDERRTRNEELYRAVDLLNDIQANSSKLKKLAAIHGALAGVARSDDRSARTKLAREMLSDWTND